MTKNVSPTNLMKPVSVQALVSRALSVILMVVSLVACAVAPVEPPAPEPVQIVVPDRGVLVAVDMYNNRNYSAAISGFDNVIGNEAASASDRRLAHLGKALVYLGNDEELHSMENAKMSLIAAGQVAFGDDDEFVAETDLLMDSVSAVIGTESKYAALQAKSSESGAEVEQLKRERDALKKQRDELLAEQKNLNEAVEKLKQLTLGN